MLRCGMFMLVSHSHRFVIFTDPMGACPWISSALGPWLDQPIAADASQNAETILFHGMTPKEAEFAFDTMGFAFRNYTRIAIIRHPLFKLSELYDRIAATDRIWRLRRRLGATDPDFCRWLHSVRPDGLGAGHRSSPRWRRFGAWSAKAWCADSVTHTVRAEYAKGDLIQVFAEIGLTPVFDKIKHDAPRYLPAHHRYDAQAQALLNNRYAWDLGLYDSDGSNLRRIA